MASGPKILISGYHSGVHTAIVSGGKIPSDDKRTDWGDVDVNHGGRYRTYYIKNVGDEMLRLTGTPMVVISGPNADAFKVTTLSSYGIGPGNNRKLCISFDPSVNGLHKAVVSIENNDPYDSPYTFAIQGNGVGAVEPEPEPEPEPPCPPDVGPCPEPEPCLFSVAVTRKSTKRVAFTVKNLTNKKIKKGVFHFTAGDRNFSKSLTIKKGKDKRIVIKLGDYAGPVLILYKDCVVTVEVK